MESVRIDDDHEVIGFIGKLTEGISVRAVGDPLVGRKAMVFQGDGVLVAVDIRNAEGRQDRGIVNDRITVGKAVVGDKNGVGVGILLRHTL